MLGMSFLALPDAGFQRNVSPRNTINYNAMQWHVMKFEFVHSLRGKISIYTNACPAPQNAVLSHFVSFSRLLILTPLMLECWVHIWRFSRSSAVWLMPQRNRAEERIWMQCEVYISIKFVIYMTHLSDINLSRIRHERRSMWWTWNECSPPAGQVSSEWHAECASVTRVWPVFG